MAQLQIDFNSLSIQEGTIDNTGSLMAFTATFTLIQEANDPA